jgi:purine-binding chemotaxis protein CheW
MGTLLATFELGRFLCAVPAADVQEVLMEQPRTPTPGASGYIAGLINLRGQVVSTLDLRLRVGLNSVDDVESLASSMSVVVRWRDEVWSLLVDRIGDVIEVEEEQFELPPETLNGPLRDLIIGAYKLESRLLLVLDVQELLSVGAERVAAHR